LPGRDAVRFLDLARRWLTTHFGNCERQLVSCLAARFHPVPKYLDARIRGGGAVLGASPPINRM